MAERGNLLKPIRVVEGHKDDCGNDALVLLWLINSTPKE